MEKVELNQVSLNEIEEIVKRVITKVVKEELSMLNEDAECEGRWCENGTIYGYEETWECSECNGTGKKSKS